jgi:hypothetical protein
MGKLEHLITHLLTHSLTHGSQEPLEDDDWRQKARAKDQALKDAYEQANNLAKVCDKTYESYQQAQACFQLQRITMPKPDRSTPAGEEAYQQADKALDEALDSRFADSGNQLETMVRVPTKRGESIYKYSVIRENRFWWQARILLPRWTKSILQTYFLALFCYYLSDYLTSAYQTS